VTYRLDDGALDELVPPASTFKVEACRWPGSLNNIETVVLSCAHGRGVTGLLARGSGRGARRGLIEHLRGRHAREHGCCR
jgi:hypothetical protein